MDFFNTVAGQRFLNMQLPQATKAVCDLAQQVTTLDKRLASIEAKLQPKQESVVTADLETAVKDIQTGGGRITMIRQLPRPDGFYEWLVIFETVAAP